jgi:AcrR family transcriptional regulator
MYRMTKAVKTPRTSRRGYRSPRREEQARLTRRSVLEAALNLFVEHGYAATTIPAVAEAAGVSVETVYKAFGNKPGLAKAVFDVTVVGDDAPVPMMQREFVRRNMAEPDPVKRLQQYGDHVAAAGDRTGPLLLVIRAAAGTDAGAGEIWAQLQQERITGMTFFARHLKQCGHLREGVTETEARDVLWLHSSVEAWDLLVRQRGWPRRRYARFIAQQLIAALL